MLTLPQIVDEFRSQNIPGTSNARDTTRTPAQIEADIEKQKLVIQRFNETLIANNLPAGMPTMNGDPYYAFAHLNTELHYAQRKGN